MPLAPNIHQCHHVRTNGVRCGSPAMRNRNHCFYHMRTTAIPRSRPTDMPNLEDGNAIQHGIASVLRRLLTYDIDYRAAYCMLHAYKLALWNLKNCHHPAGGSSEVVTVDPATDPENAGDATEPQNPRDIAAILRSLAPEAATTAAADSNDEDADDDPHTQLRKFLARELISPEEAAAKRAATAPPAPGAPPARSSQVGTESGIANTDRAPSNAASSTPHWVGRANDSTPLGKPETGNGKPALSGKPIHRISIPRELEDLIKGEPNPNISDDELMRLAADMFNMKTG